MRRLLSTVLCTAVFAVGAISGAPLAAAAAPSNDNLADAIPLTNEFGRAEGTLEGATSEPGEHQIQSHCSPDCPSVWYRWKSPYAFPVEATFRMCDTSGGSSYTPPDTILEVFHGVESVIADPGLVR